MTIEQVVSTVVNTDVAINAEITSKASDSWVVYMIILWHDDSMVTILFQRTSAGV